MVRNFHTVLFSLLLDLVRHILRNKSINIIIFCSIIFLISTNMVRNFRMLLLCLLLDVVHHILQNKSIKIVIFCSIFLIFSNILICLSSLRIMIRLLSFYYQFFYEEVLFSILHYQVSTSTCFTQNKQFAIIHPYILDLIANHSSAL